MLRLTTLALVAAFAAAANAPARAADEPKDVVAKAIKAHGGEKVLGKFKAAQVKVKGTVDVPGAGEVEFTQETSYMFPDKFRDSHELTVNGQTVSVLLVVNGDKVLVEVNGKEVDAGDKVKDALKEVRRVIQVGRLVTLADKKYELSLIGEDKVEGRKAVGVRVSSKGEGDVGLYFDQKTGLTAKVEFRTADPATGNEVTEERIVTEYAKNKDGVPTPKKILIKRDGKKYVEAEVVEMQMLEKLDDAVFKK